MSSITNAKKLKILLENIEAVIFFPWWIYIGWRWVLLLIQDIDKKNDLLGRKNLNFPPKQIYICLFCCDLVIGGKKIVNLVW